jgi:hypothetical protein
MPDGYDSLRDVQIVAGHTDTRTMSYHRGRRFPTPQQSPTRS